MIKMEEEYQKELKQITERIVTVEEDMGELLMLYKEIVFAHWNMEVLKMLNVAIDV